MSKLIPGVGFTLPPNAITKRKTPIDVSADPWDANGMAKPEPEFRRLWAKRYGGAVDAEGLHESDYGAALATIWEKNREWPGFNRRLPSSAYDGGRNKRERADAYMSEYGNTVLKEAYRLRGVRVDQRGGDTVVSPTALLFEVPTGFRGRKEAVLSVIPAGVNAPWTHVVDKGSLPSVVKLASFHTEERPRGGSGPGDLRVWIDVTGDPPRGTYAGTVTINSANKERDVVLVSVRIGEAAPVPAPEPKPEPTPAPEPGPTPPPAREPFTLSEASLATLRELKGWIPEQQRRRVAALVAEIQGKLSR